MAASAAPNSSGVRAWTIVSLICQPRRITAAAQVRRPCMSATPWFAVTEYWLLLVVRSGSGFG
jgi:hypothetical protein